VGRADVCGLVGGEFRRLTLRSATGNGAARRSLPGQGEGRSGQVFEWLRNHVMPGRQVAWRKRRWQVTALQGS